jgi:FtsZ-binding cell division protein ZapB
MKEKSLGPLWVSIVVPFIVVIALLVTIMNARIKVQNETIRALQVVHERMREENALLSDRITRYQELVRRADSLTRVEEAKRDSIKKRLDAQDKHVKVLLGKIAGYPDDSAYWHYHHRVLPDIEHRFGHYLRN